jgi:hypothetical protein
MSKRRRWSEWPKRSLSELNAYSGLASVGGVAFSISSWALLAGTASTILTGVGLVISVGAFGVAVVRAIPPALKQAEDLVGQEVSLSDLKSISPRILSVAIIGPSMAGKTTLRDRLTFTASAPIRTQKASGYIATLQTAPQKYLAILDGGGEKYAQQFALAEECDCLCVLIDHNASHTDSLIDVQRLEEHKEFLQQVRHFLDEKQGAPKRWIHILINKHDLWGVASAADQSTLSQFYNAELLLWRQGNRAHSIDVQPHSNAVQLDVVAFVNKLKHTVLN